MSETLLEFEVGDVLVDNGEVTITLEGEPDPAETLHPATEPYQAEILPTDFNTGPNLSDHMDQTTFDQVPAAKIAILAPRRSQSQAATSPKQLLHADAGVANRAELEFSTQRAEAA